MKVAAAGIMLFLLCCATHAQPALNKTYGTLTANDGYTIITEQNGYFVGGGGYSNNFGGWYCIKLWRIDSLGQIIWTKEYGQNHQAWETLYFAIKKYYDGGYIIPAQIRDSLTGNYSAMLLRVDSLGTQIWKRTVQGGSAESFTCCVVTADGGIVTTGITTSQGDVNGDMTLIKYDSNGNFIWRKKYGGNKWDSGYHLAVSPDGGFLVSGLTQSSGRGTTNNYFVKTDSVGDVIWEKTYGPLGDNGACFVEPAVSGYLMTAQWDTIQHPGNGGISCIVKLDTLGNIVWSKIYGDTINISQCSELPNGEIVAAGQKNKPTGYYFQGGLITKLNAIGNTLWERNLVYDGSDVDTTYSRYVYGVLWDFKLCRDNGFILTGHSTYNTITEQINEMWLVKTDSMGCVGSYCGLVADTIDGIDTKLFKDNTNLAAYPNPAGKEVVIDYAFDNDNVGNIFILYNMLGNVIFSQSLTQQKGKIVLDISFLTNGLYIYNLKHNEAILKSGKLSVVK